MHTSPLLYTGNVSVHYPQSLFAMGAERFESGTVRVRTVRMPHIRQELHLWRRKGIVLGELKLGGEHAALKWCAFWPLDKSFP